MPRVYKKKDGANRLFYSEESMIAAVEAVGDGMKVSIAAKTHRVPLSTICDRLNRTINSRDASEGPQPFFLMKKFSLLSIWLCLPIAAWPLPEWTLENLFSVILMTITDM